MSPGDRARLIRLVLALYPRAVRDRYGEEIELLLHRSPRPLRDLADVTRCALHERRVVETPRLRSYARRSAGILAVPPLLGAALLTVASVGVLTVATVAADASQSFVGAVVALAVVPVSGAAAWLGRRASHRGGRPAAVPALLALGVLALSALPLVGAALGAARAAVATGTAVWCLLLTALVGAVRRFSPRVPWPVTAVLVALAGLAVLDLSFVAYAGAEPPSNVLVASCRWYPTVVTGYDFGTPRAATELAETLKGLPALLTACTAFTLGRVASPGHLPGRPGRVSRR